MTDPGLQLLGMIKAGRAFQSLSDENQKYLSQHGVLAKLRKNEFLWQRHDPGDYCVHIFEGLIEIVNINEQAEQRIVGIFGPGDIVGLSAILKRSVFPASAVIASKTCRIMKFYIRSANHDLDSNQRDNMSTWQREMLLHHEQILRDKIVMLGAGRLQTRLIAFFDHMRLRFSKDLDPKAQKVFIPIALTKTQIAKVVEARVETVIRELNKWEKAGYLTMGDDGVTLERLDRLRLT